MLKKDSRGNSFTGTYIEEYFNKMQNGEIIVCNKIYKTYEKLVKELYNPYKNYVFDDWKAYRCIDFIEKFCMTSTGKLGEKLELQLFQKAMLEAVFGFVDKDTGYRRYKEVLDILGRKNGKTTLLGGINNYMTVADGEAGAENYIVATKLEQSQKCFNEVHNMVKQSKELSKVLRKRKSDIYFEPTFSFVKALASNSNGLDGLNAHLCTIDELAAIKNRDLYDLMKQSMSARRQPMLFCITTNGFVREGIFDAQYDYAVGVLEGKFEDDEFISFIYELDSLDEWDKPEMWIKANPGLGTIKNLKDLQGYVNKAKNDRYFKPTVLVKDFNMKQTPATAWLSWEELDNEEMFSIEDMGFSYGIGCLDYAETTDLASAKVLCMRPNDPNIYVIPMYWIPRSKIADIRNDHMIDGVPYHIWEQRGLIRVREDNKNDPYDILHWFEEIRELHGIYLPWIGYDPWHIDNSVLQAFEMSFGKDAMIKVRQGAQTLSQPMKELKAEFEAHRVIYNNNPIDKWCLSNMEVKVDINANIQPIKGMDKTKRIDGGVSLLIGYVVLKDKWNDYQNMI